MRRVGTKATASFPKRRPSSIRTTRCRARAVQSRPDAPRLWSLVDGAMRRFVPVPTRILHRMPAGLTFEQAALTEPCCVAFNAVVDNARIRPGDRIVVLGPGPIGILGAAIARLCGASVAVVGLEHDRTRLDVAKQYGCEADRRRCDRVGRKKSTAWAPTASSTPPAFLWRLTTALDLVRPAGWISKVGWGPQPLGFSLDRLVQKNVTLQGSFSHNWPIWERVIRLIAPARSTCGRSPAASGRCRSGTKRLKPCTPGRS